MSHNMGLPPQFINVPALNRPSRSNHPFNRAVRFDREFFEAYPNQQFLIRAHIPGEVFPCEPPVVTFDTSGHEMNMTVVKQLYPGARRRGYFFVEPGMVWPTTNAEIERFLASRGTLI